MTTALHAGLVAGRWYELSLLEQLANIGSEVGRAARAKALGNEARFAGALDRCLELFDLTLADDRWHGRRREIARARELVCDFLVGDDEYGSTAESLDAYFLQFAVAARRNSRPSAQVAVLGAADGHVATTSQQDGEGSLKPGIAPIVGNRAVENAAVEEAPIQPVGLSDRVLDPQARSAVS